MPSEFPDKPRQEPASGLPVAEPPVPLVPGASLSDAEQERMHRLALELRCLVCQNQSIADSNSGLAVDLRRQIAGQIRDGKSDAAIKQYMVERYGDFVLYKPPFSMHNAALWIGPFILLLVGIVLAMRSIRRRRLAGSGSDGTTPAPQGADDTRFQEIEERYQRDSNR